MATNNNKNNYGIFYNVPKTNEENLKEKEKEKISQLNIIHKYVSCNFFTLNEINNIKKIYLLENYDKKYYIINSVEELQITNFSDDDKYIVSGKIIQEDEKILLNYERKEIMYLNTYLKALSCSRKYILDIINFYRILLDSIHLLVQNDLVHNNINFKTIMIDDKCRPLISDFSLSIPTNKEDIGEFIKHFIIEYNPKFLQWPMEFHILSYMLTNKLQSLSNYNIEIVIDDVTNENQIIQNFGKEFVSSYSSEAKDYFKKYSNKKYECIIKDILDYSNTWDNYALSVMFLRILIGIHKYTSSIITDINKKNNKFIILFMKLLVGNINSVPFKRLSIQDTTNKFKILLDNIRPAEFKDLLTNLHL